MDNSVVDNVFKILEEEVSKFREPIVSRVAHTLDPFQVLVSTMLSLRTKDSTTEAGFKRLFALASTPEQVTHTPLSEIEKAIYPVGFYRTKAKKIQETAVIIVERYNGKVPSDMTDLLSLPGVGRKTANLVIILAYGGLGICVDTHVHRITNRWGYLSSKNPEETEMRLRQILPVKYWKKINDYLVTYGQNLCTPINPCCSRCRIIQYCSQVGVKKSR